MNRLAGNGDSSPPLFSRIRFDDLADFDVCWAGLNPLQAGFLFGSEQGSLLFMDEQGNRLGRAKGSLSGEAINGVAYWEQWLAISTRAEVDFFLTPISQNTQVVPIPAGAHGVITTKAGYFVAPLGKTGLLVLRPEPVKEQRVTVFSGRAEESPYLYRVIALRQGGREVLACAGRAEGVATMEFKGVHGSNNLSMMTFDGFDVVDICPLEPGRDSLAAAAISKDGTLILFQNVLEDKQPITMRFQAIEETAYRLLSCLGDVYVLTSKGLYMLANVAEHFLKGELKGAPTPVLPIPLEATDANLYKDEYLLVVTLDEVQRYDIRLIHDSAKAFLAQGRSFEQQPETISPNRNLREIQQITKQLVTAAG
jgi:hypothetical protein